MKDEMRSREEDVLRNGLRFLADKGVPSNSVPWQQIRTKLIQEQKGKTMKNISTQRQGRLPWLNAKSISLAVVILACIAGLLFLPQGSVFADRFARFFNLRPNTRSLPMAVQTSPVMPTPTKTDVQNVTLVPVESNHTVSATPTVKPDPQAFFLQVEQPTQANTPKTVQTLPIERLKSSAGFEVFSPLELPQGYSLLTAAYDQGSGNVVLTYATSIEEKSHLLVILTETKDQSPNDIGLKAQVEEVSLGEMTGELVQGGWTTAEGQSVEVWNNGVPLVTLRWMAKDIYFTVQITELRETNSVQFSLRDEAISIAKSLMEIQYPPPNNQASKNLAKCLSIPEVEKLAGFHATQPTVLPAGVAFTCAEFQQMVYPTIILRYQQTEGEHRLSLIFFETPKALIPGGKMSVAATDGKVESVTILDQPGFFVVGSQISQLPGTWEQGTPPPLPVWDQNSSVKLLSWGSTDLWIEMQSLDGLQKEALLQIAESMK